jgi:hypothetical protein
VLGVSVLVIAVLGMTPAAPARRAPGPEKVALAAIARLAASGSIDAASAAGYRSAVTRAVALIPRLPPGRALPLDAQLAQAAAVAPELSAPRALALFSQLAVNDDWFARHGAPPSQTDITDADGVVYRYFPSGFEFHPLGNFAALNAAALSRNVSGTALLANALAARGVSEPGGGLGFEYYFDYAGGRAPWLSGFAQAVAAQAFARAAQVDTADSAMLLATARAAFLAIPGRLVRPTEFGPWIRLYSFGDAVVLNAQLQSAISLAGFARATSDAAAGSLAADLTTAAARALPSFSTGYWSYYQLPGDPSPLGYQNYVVGLLQTLARTDQRFSAAADAFARFGTEAPAFRLADAGVGAVSFWVSQPSTVRVSALDANRWLSVTGGWHTVSWALPAHAGIFPVQIRATDWAGNATTIEALPIVRVVSAPKTKRGRARQSPARTPAAVDSTLPPLVIGAGLQQPEQASLALQQGLGAARMTLVWPAGASVPSAGAITALRRLPPGTNLVLELYAAPLPSDSASTGALAAYAAAVASQVPALRDLLLGPAATSPAGAAGYESALAAVYDAVKAAAPSVRVGATLDGAGSPKPVLAALGSAYRASARPGPVMDELAFSPAPATGKGVWALGDLPALVAGIGTAFAGTGQPAATLPLIIDGIAFQSAIPPGEVANYSSPAAATAGLDEPSQGTAYATALSTVACVPTVEALLFAQLVDGPGPGEQSGLFYVDGTPKTSLSAVAAAAAAAETPSRGCSTAQPGAPAPARPPAPIQPVPPPAPTQAPPAATTPAPAAGAPVADAQALAFPAQLVTSTPPRVRVGCTSACLYLVTMLRSSDGQPVLATRGAFAHPGAAWVTLPKAPYPAGAYRFAVWLVAASNPGPITVERSGVVAASG